MAQSLDTYAPYATGSGANVGESQWRAFMSRARPDGVLDGVTNLCNVYGNSTGMFVYVDLGELWILGQWGQNLTVKTLPVAANATGSVRYDLVVARNRLVDDRMEFDVITGTSSTTPPTPTQNSTVWEIPLGFLAVPNGAATITAGNVTAWRQYGYPYVQLHMSGTPGSPPVFTTAGTFVNQWFDTVDEGGADNYFNLTSPGTGGTVGSPYLTQLFVNRPGIWLVGFSCRAQGSTSGTSQDLYGAIFKNGSTSEEFGADAPMQTNVTGQTTVWGASEPMRLAQGDYIQVKVKNSTGNTWTSSAAGKTVSLRARWLQY